MKILQLDERKGRNAVKIEALMGTSEFKQLNGNLTELVTFAASEIYVQTTFTKTGAKLRSVKYMLLPATLRRMFKLDEYDFSQLRCGVLEYKDLAYVIYGIPKQSHTVEQVDGS